VKAEIHPEYVVAHVRCTCGNEFTTHATRDEFHLEICSNCHPFYTGRQKLVDTGGRVERFQRRVAKGRLRGAREAARKGGARASERRGGAEAPVAGRGADAASEAPASDGGADAAAGAAGTDGGAASAVPPSDSTDR
jgi:large subunit ribosomal protein L31